MSLLRKISESKSGTIFLITAIWVFIQAILISQYGIVTKLEADTYLTVARQLIDTGHYPSGNFLFYSVQILLDAACIKAGTGFWPIIVLQMLLNLISVFLFYRLIFTFSGRKTIALCFTLALLGMYYYQLYNVHLYTESIYFSLSIIYSYFLFSLEKLSVKTLSPVFLLMLLLCITRPTGIFYLPATYLFFIFKFFRKKALLITGISSIVAVAGFYFIVNFAIGSGGALNFLLPYTDGNVLCGVPTFIPAADIRVPGNANSVAGLWYIITHYPNLFFSLAAKRLGTFFGIYRSYYSLLHNLYSCSFFYISYLLLILSFRKLLKYWLAETLYMLSIILCFTITVSLTCDEWHNRFILGLMAFFLLLASVFFNKQESPKSNGKRTIK